MCEIILNIYYNNKFLIVAAPSVQIVDAMGDPLRDKYYEADSNTEFLFFSSSSKVYKNLFFILIYKSPSNISAMGCFNKSYLHYFFNLIKT